jgi:hypothetical protein
LDIEVVGNASTFFSATAKIVAVTAHQVSTRKMDTTVQETTANTLRTTATVALLGFWQPRMLKHYRAMQRG